MRANIVIILSLLTAATAVRAQQVEDKVKRVDMGKTMCRSEDVTGSAFAQKICHTRQEWKDIDSASKSDRSGASSSRVLHDSPGLRLPGRPPSV